MIFEEIPMFITKIGTSKGLKRPEKDYKNIKVNDYDLSLDILIAYASVNDSESYIKQ